MLHTTSSPESNVSNVGLHIITIHRPYSFHNLNFVVQDLNNYITNLNVNFSTLLPYCRLCAMHTTTAHVHLQDPTHAGSKPNVSDL